MNHEFDKWIGLIGLSVVLYYIFSNAQGTSDILTAFGRFNANFIGALQGRQTVGI